MKRVICLLAACLSLSPFVGHADETLDLKLPEKPSSYNLNFYIASNFLFSIAPGVRWQYGKWGLDGGVGLSVLGGIQSVNLNGLFYFNPEATTKHYLSLGVSTFPLARSIIDDVNTTWREAAAEEDDDNDQISLQIRPAIPSIAYGFQKGFKKSGYLFMNFGIYGPIGVQIVGDEGTYSAEVPLPFVNIGYAF